MSSDRGEDYDVETLRAAREEAHRTLDGQLGNLDDIDGKALAVFRLDIALVGVLLSGLSFAAATDLVLVADLLNPATVAGLGLFVVSAVAAGLTYVTGGHRVGPGPAGLERAGTLPEAAYLDWLVTSYAEWIRRNEQANVRKALLMTFAVLGAVAGTLGLAVGVAVAVTDRPVLSTVIAVLVFTVMVVLADVPAQLRRWTSPRPHATADVAAQDRTAPMAGQQALRGRDRE